MPAPWLPAVHTSVFLHNENDDPDPVLIVFTAPGCPQIMALCHVAVMNCTGLGGGPYTQYSIVLQCAGMNWPSLHCTALYCIPLNLTSLHFSEVQYIRLNCTELCMLDWTVHCNSPGCCTAVPCNKRWPILPATSIGVTGCDVAAYLLFYWVSNIPRNYWRGEKPLGIHFK